MLFLARNYTEFPYEQCKGIIAKRYFSLAQVLKPFAQQEKITLNESGAYAFTTQAPRLKAVLNRIESFYYDLADDIALVHPEASISYYGLCRERSVSVDRITPETGSVLVSTYDGGFVCDDLQFLVYITVTHLGAKIPNCDTVISVSLVTSNAP